MLRKLSFYMALACTMASCTSHSDSIAEPTESKNITFMVSEQMPISRASLSDACSRLSYYRITNGLTTETIHQQESDADFGTIVDELDYGSHQLYFVGYNTASEVQMNSTDKSYTFDKVSDTFSYYTTLSVDKNTNTTQSISMPRRVARFEMVVSDALPENLQSMTITIEGAATALHTESGMGAKEVTQIKTISVPTTNLGKKGCTFIAYAFLLTETDNVTVTLTANDSQGNILQEHQLDDVELQTNYITRYTGNFFADGFSTDLSATADWKGVKENEF